MKKVKTTEQLKEEKVNYLMKELMNFKDKTIEEMEVLIELSLKSAYSAGAYQSSKEIIDLINMTNKKTT